MMISRRWNGAVRISTEINKYITFRAGANYSKRNKRYAYATNSTTADPWLYPLPLGQYLSYGI